MSGYHRHGRHGHPPGGGDSPPHGDWHGHRHRGHWGPGKWGMGPPWAGPPGKWGMPPPHWGGPPGKWGMPPPHWGAPPPWGPPPEHWSESPPQYNPPPYPPEIPPNYDEIPRDPGPADGGSLGWHPSPPVPAQQPLPINPEKDGFSGRVIVLYQGTTEAIGKAVMTHNLSLPETKGSAGTAIYFDTSKEIAQRKAGNNGAVLVSQVTVGTSLVLRTALELTLVNIVRLGCDSVKVSGVNSEDEYAIFDPRQVSITEVWIGGMRVK